MAFIHIPRRHLVQPQGAAEFAPEFDRFLFAHLGGQSRLVGLNAAFPGALGVTAEIGGVGSKPPSNTTVTDNRIEPVANRKSVTIVASLLRASGDYSLFSVTTAGFGWHLSVENWDAGLCSIGPRSSWGGANVFPVGTSVYRLSGQVGDIITVATTWRDTGTNSDVYRSVNGGPIVSRIGGPRLDGNTGNGNSSVTIFNSASPLFLFAVAEGYDIYDLRELSASPYQIFRRQPQRLYFLPDTGGGVEASAQPSQHGHISTEPALTQAGTLAPGNSQHGHQSETVNLLQANTLDAQGAMHGHIAQGVDITQALVLTIGDSVHGHVSDNLEISQAHTLDVGDAVHQHTATGVELSIGGNLIVGNSEHEHVAESVNLTQASTLSVFGSVHQHISTGLNLVIPGLLRALKSMLRVRITW